MKGKKKIITFLLSLLLLLPNVTIEANARGNASGQWRSGSGGWWFAYSRGGYPAAQWELINNQWYYFNGSGYMATGWKNLSGYWYYLKSSGAMATGWNAISGEWYYFDSNGHMLTGWQNIKGNWYYMNSSGAMCTGWVQSGSSWYLLGSDGHMLTGWQNYRGNWYYLNSSGAMCKGWLKSGSSWYLLGSDGRMLTGWNKYGGYWYFLDAAGRMLTGWINYNGGWYYTNSSGVMLVGSHTIDGKTYNFDSSGRMISESEQWTPVYYSQRDSQWSSLQFGPWTMYSTGCVPTSLAMIFSGLGTTVYPGDVATWLYNNTTEFNQRSVGGGGLCAEYASAHWGFNYKGLGSISAIEDELTAGRMVIAYEGEGLFAKAGNSHAIVLFKYSSGSTYVYDPWDSGRNGWYSISTLWSQKSTDPDDNLGGYVYYSIYK